MNKGILTVVSGFSGAGKGTVVNRLVEKYDDYALSISATTRSPRKGEIHGKDYYFISREEFENMIEKDELLEYACYVDCFYGTPRSYVEEQLYAGKDVILEIEIQGAHKIKEKFPDTVLLFLTPPDIGELKRRLEGRKTETEEKIRSRLRRACEESEGMDTYDYLVVNDDLDRCVQTVHGIIQSEHQRSGRKQALIRRLQKELQEYAES